MIKINSEVLNQFAKEGITINEGIAVDARLVKSASRPISNDEIKKLRKKKETAEGKVDKNGKPLKFSRDLESDWVVQNDNVQDDPVDSGFVRNLRRQSFYNHGVAQLRRLTISFFGCPGDKCLYCGNFILF